MTATVLVIAEDDSLRDAWSAAATRAGFQVRAVSALLPGIDLLGTQEVDGVIIDARDDAELALIAAVSAYRPMPVTVIVHDRVAGIPARIRGVALRPHNATPERIVHLLGRLLLARELANPTNLPVRVTPFALKWTSRLSSKRAPVAFDDDDDSAEIRRQFEGETNPDGFELATS
jgi:DNA-binding NtrC family response regulator